MIDKARTLKGPMTGEILTIAYRDDGTPYNVTVWDGILFTKRNLPPDCPKFETRDGAVCIGGLWWREIPHPIQRNATSMAYYPDTHLNWLSDPANTLPERTKRIAVEIKDAAVEKVRGWWARLKGVLHA